MGKNSTIQVESVDVTITKRDGDDFISLTDMAKARGDSSRAADVIKNWIRTRTTLEFLGTWEQIYNPDFKVVEFDHFKSQAGLPTFVLSPSQWVEKTGAKGIFAKSGRYGGTYAHRDIAFEFGSAISPKFKLFLLREFQRLKAEENDRLKLEWNIQRTLSKINYSIHTDAIKEELIPSVLTPKEISNIYASEEDLLNMSLFGMTAKQWRAQAPPCGTHLQLLTRLERIFVLFSYKSL
ncbi:MAG: KilA-N domain-containing protein [Verrucomicrobiota bacterium]